MVENGETTSGVAKRMRPKKSAPLTTRITRQTRAALEAEAQRSDRSISEVAEDWMNLAISGRASADDELGGLHVADTVRALIRVAKDLEKEMGDPAVDAYARRALITSWAAIMQNALPFTPPSAEEEQRAEARELALSALRILWREVSAKQPGSASPNIEATSGEAPSDVDSAPRLPGYPHSDASHLASLPLWRLISLAMKTDDWAFTNIPEALGVKLAELIAAKQGLPQFEAVLMSLKAYKHADDAYMTKTVEAQQRGRRLANTIAARRNEGTEDLKALWNDGR